MRWSFVTKRKEFAKITGVHLICLAMLDIFPSRGRLRGGCELTLTARYANRMRFARYALRARYVFRTSAKNTICRETSFAARGKQRGDAVSYAHSAQL